MISTEEQRKLDKELLRECRGYSERDNKPDGAYIKVKGIFFNLNKIKRLIEAGANVDTTGNWPLNIAADRDNIALAKLLISAGANVNAKDENGTLPLHVAVWKNNVALAEYLISAGADVDAKNNRGESPLYFAISGGSKEMEALLKQHGAI